MGDFELGTSLRDVLFGLERIVCDAGKRANSRLRSLPADEVFHRLDRAMFGRNTSSDEDIADHEQWARHVILPAVDVFDSWKGYLVEAEGHERLIIGHRPTGKIQEVLLGPGQVDEVLRIAAHDIGALYEREMGWRD